MTAHHQKISSIIIIVLINTIITIIIRRGNPPESQLLRSMLLKSGFAARRRNQPITHMAAFWRNRTRIVTKSETKLHPVRSFFSCTGTAHIHSLVLMVHLRPVNTSPAASGRVLFPCSRRAFALLHPDPATQAPDDRGPNDSRWIPIIYRLSRGVISS
jgi:hypothetical protein